LHSQTRNYEGAENMTSIQEETISIERPQVETFSVDPARLASGEWRHDLQKTIGRGDINASYSADRIGMGQPIRKPFEWRGGLWVCVSMTYLKGVVSAEAYRLVHPARFSREPVSYAQKTRDGYAARHDANGFYHGMTVKHAGALMVLCGPPARIEPGVALQMDLFA
jgi:hypothetical protein